jgi:hypothetical protein
LLRGRLKLLLIVWIYRCLPLLVWIVRVVRHLVEEYGPQATEVDSRDRCNIKGGENVNAFSRRI